MPIYLNSRKYQNLPWDPSGVPRPGKAPLHGVDPLSLHRKINNYNPLLECNESLKIHYSSSSLSDSSLSGSPSKYDSIVSISLMRISSTESVMDLVDPR